MSVLTAGIMVNAYQAGRSDHRSGAAHRTDDPGVDAGVYLFPEPRHQQQVVVGADGQQDDDRHRLTMSAVRCRARVARPEPTARGRAEHSTTVPTMTAAATRLRVMSSMMMNQRQRGDAIRVMVIALLHVLVDRRGATRMILDPSRGCP